MSGIESPDELHGLRLRAYGPDADIHLDPQALHRLRELEGRSAPQAEAIADEADSEQPKPQPEESAEPDVTEPAAKRSLRVRRSTVLVALGVAAVAALIATSLTLVQRTQAAPLQADARQIARLSADPDYRVPNVVTMAGQGTGARGYESFHGLRAAVSTDVAPDACLSVFSPAGVIDDNSFNGMIHTACAAGGFPAAVQFRVDSSLPEDLRSAFPKNVALQFVYDEHDEQIVVYADPSTKGRGERS